MSDKYSFVGALGMLIRQSLKILGEENSPGAVSAIHNYQARLDATVEKYESVHKNYFATVFRTHSDEIVRGYRNDGWLVDNDVSIVFGSENPEASHKGYIPLSKIYGCGLKAVKRASTEDDQLILYPQIFLLHLYRIFNSLRSDDSYSELFLEGKGQKVFDCMTELEADLKSGELGESNIKAYNLTFRKANPSMVNPTEALKNMMNDPMLDNIFGMVTNSFAQSGMIPKEELEKISVNDIRKQFNSILGTPALMKTFEHMNENMGSAKTPEEAIQMSMKMMSDEKFVKDIMAAKDEKEGVVVEEVEKDPQE